jgi:hypothetical protein
VLGDIRAHLDAADAGDAQIRDNVDGVQVDLRRGELAFEPTGEGLNRLVKRGRVRPELRVGADQSQMKEEGQVRKSREESMREAASSANADSKDGARLAEWRAGFEVEPTPPGRAPPRKMNRLRPKSAMRG